MDLRKSRGCSTVSRRMPSRARRLVAPPCTGHILSATCFARRRAGVYLCGFPCTRESWAGKRRSRPACRPDPLPPKRPSIPSPARRHLVMRGATAVEGQRGARPETWQALVIRTFAKQTQRERQSAGAGRALGSRRLVYTPYYPAPGPYKASNTPSSSGPRCRRAFRHDWRQTPCPD